jgi:AbrB family looped-hinge helix DNA binding protein
VKKELLLDAQVSDIEKNRYIYIFSKNNLTMVQIDITRMSSKGQVVIPQELRKNFNEGDKIVVIRNDDQIILKKADKFDKQVEEDILVAKRVDEAWKEIEQGKFKRMSSEDFLKEIRNLK